MKVKLTKTLIERTPVPPKGKITELWDADLDGLFLRVYPSGQRSFVCYYRQAQKRKRVVLGSYPVLSLDDARKKATRLLGVRLHGLQDPSGKLAEQEAPAGTLTLGQLLQRYLNEKVLPDATRIGSSTGKSVKSIINHPRLADLNSVLVTDLRKPQVQSFYKRVLLKETKYLANQTLSYVRAGWNWGASEGLCPELNPASRIDRKSEDKRKRVLDYEEVARVFEQFERLRLDPRTSWFDRNHMDAIEVMFLTSKRRSSIVTLAKDKVDRSRGFMTVKEKAKNGEPNWETVPITTQVAAVLDRVVNQGSPWVFPKQNNPKEHMNVGSIYDFWTVVRAQIGLSDVRLHDFRRTNLTYGQEEVHLDREALAKQAGHSGLKNLPHYIAPTERQKAKNAQAIADNLDQLVQLGRAEARKLREVA